jgi:MFS family permease
MALGRSAGMAAGPLVGGALFAYRGYRMVYGTAFLLIALDIVLRLILVLESRAPADVPAASRSRLPASLRLLQTARMWTAIWGSFHSAFLCGGLDAVLPLFVWRAYSWNSIQAGAAFLALVGPSLLSPLVGWLVQKFGTRWCAVVGYGATGIMLALLAIITRDGGSHQSLLVTLLLFTGTFALLSETASWVDAATVADIQTRHCPSKFSRGGAIASVYALTNIMFALGFVVGPLATGFTFAHLGWEAVSLLLAVITLIGTVPSLIWTERSLSFAEDPCLAGAKLAVEA